MANARFLVSRTVLLLLLCAVFGVTSALSQRVFRAVLDGTQETPPVTATTAAGQRVSKATVFLTDSQGVTRTARTGSLGYFNFANVLAGESYVVVIGHKR